MLKRQWNHLNPVVRAISARQDDGGSNAGNCLPTDLLASAPDCSLNCILEFVQTNYEDTACSFSSSLTYLCTSRTSSGLTIGEGAVQCLASRCTGQDLERTEAYSVCGNVPGAIANTVGVITATIQLETSTMLNPLPPTIGTPTASPEVTSIFMTSGVPSMGPPRTTPTASDSSDDTLIPSQTFEATTSSSPTSTGNTAAISDGVTESSTLSTPAIAGISVASALLILLILVVIIWRCRRKGKAKRRRSDSWSMHGAQTPQFSGPPPHTPAMANAHMNPLPSPLGANQRYYAASLQDQKRRSFWRRSIKPEEIGVAVSPYVREPGSPASITSHQSLANLLPKVPEKLPTRASTSLWPAPLTFDYAQQRRSTALRPNSVSTVFDEDIEANAATRSGRLSDARDSVVFGSAPKARRQHVPLPLQLNPLTPRDIAPVARPATQSPPNDRMPLTPTYDNGNFDIAPRNYPPTSWKPMGQIDDVFAAPPLSALPEDLSPTRKPRQMKNVLRKKPFQNQMWGEAGDRSNTRSPEAKPFPLRKNSETTAGTDIEEDTTPPEEVEKYLWSPPVANNSRSIPYEEPRSPISNLKYPSIPRPAAVSRQAEVPAMPAPMPSLAVPDRPRRDELVRNGASFMVTDTTSSDGYISDHSIEWPKPPTAGGSQPEAKNQTGLGLRENSLGVNRGMPQRSMDRMLQYGPRSSSLAVSPIGTRAKLMPNTNSRGDMFFTVEM